jgi:hypothetical protein
MRQPIPFLANSLVNSFFRRPGINKEDDMQVILRREPTNPYDRNAVQVLNVEVGPSTATLSHIVCLN